MHAAHSHVVITGGAGFLGSAVAWHLNRAGIDDLVLVDGTADTQQFRNVAGTRFADYFHADEFLRRIEGGSKLPALQAVIHLGACSSTMESDGAFLMRNNFAYSRSVASWCLAHQVRFIYASSAATYGAGENGYDDSLEQLPQLRPLNGYAFSKHAFDLWAMSHGAFNSITGLKYFNVYGPNEYHKGDMRSMVLKAFEQIQAGGRVRLFRSYRLEVADGEQTRDFIYVKDAAATTAWFLEHPEATGIYNIGSGVGRSWNDLAGAVFRGMGAPMQVEYIEMPSAIRNSYQYATCARLSRLQQAGCELQPMPLERGVEEYVRAYLMTTDPYLQRSSQPLGPTAT